MSPSLRQALLSSVSSVNSNSFYRQGREARRKRLGVLGHLETFISYGELIEEVKGHEKCTHHIALTSGFLKRL